MATVSDLPSVIPPTSQVVAFTSKPSHSGSSVDSLIYYQSVRGLRTKLFTLHQTFTYSFYKIIIFTETWLTSAFCSQELRLGNYEIFRCDRNAHTSDFLRGGGVLIACYPLLRASRVTNSILTIEYAFVKFISNSITYIVGTFYIPPNSKLNIYLNVCTVLEDLYISHPSAVFCIMGDFNLPNVTWKAELSDEPSCVPTLDSTKLCKQIATFLSNCIDYMNLTQINNFDNSHGSVLDLVLYNLLNYSLVTCDDPILPVDSYHSPLILTIHNIIGNRDNLSTNHDSFKYNFECANVNGICTFLDEIDWNVVFDSLNLDDPVSIFYNKFYLAINLFVPLKRIKDDNYPPWFTHQLKRLIYLKKIAHRNFKVSNKYHDSQEFSNLRSACKELSKLSLNSYITKIENNVVSNPKLFWNYVNQLKRETRIASEVVYNNMSANTPVNIANLFADYFSSVHTSSSNDIPASYFHFNNDLTINANLITKEMIAVKLKNLKVNKGTGPDEVPLALLKSCSSSLIEPLYILFNRSLKCGTFPFVWKRGIIVPVYCQ